MASSSNNELSPAETLNPSSTVNSQSMSPHDSPSQTHEQEQLQLSNPQSMAANENNGGNLGEKRKRDETAQPETEEKVDPSLNPYYKTSLCSYFRRNSGSCSHGSECRYAHGEAELRPRPDNTWDPTSERAKKALKLEDNGDKCEEGKEEEVMMTEMLVDDSEGGEGGCLDPELSKCLVHLPRKWNSDNLRNFLSEQVSFFFFFFLSILKLSLNFYFSLLLFKKYLNSRNTEAKFYLPNE